MPLAIGSRIAVHIQGVLALGALFVVICRRTTGLVWTVGAEVISARGLELALRRLRTRQIAWAPASPGYGADI